MTAVKPLARVSFLLWGLVLLDSGCVVTEPREGYYDHDHNRWYHDHAWQACGEHDEHCR
jgi:hypothetical protein